MLYVVWCLSLQPVSIVSYNHLGNNDGKNLSAPKQFRSKEVSGFWDGTHVWQSHVESKEYSVTYNIAIDSHALCRCTDVWCGHKTCMSPTLNRTSAVWNSEHSDAINLNFYTQLSQMWSFHNHWITAHVYVLQCLVCTCSCAWPFSFFSMKS